MTDGRTGLWGGWSLILPPGTQATRNADGSWSAWDASHVVDVSIVETAGRSDGSPLTAAEMLSGDARGVEHELDGAIVRVYPEVETTDTPDGPQPVEWTRVHAGATNTTLIMSIGNQGPRDVLWHDAVWQSIRHAPPRRGILGSLLRKR